MKYKVGDKVRIVRSNVVDYRHFVGRIGSIVEAKLTAAYPYIIESGSELIAGRWRDDELELVVDPPTFKVGDRVKVVAANVGCKERYVGEVGLIDAIESRWYVPYAVRWDNGRRGPYMWSANELELIAPLAERAPSYAVGDKIRVLPTTTTGYAGRTFTVASIDVYEGKARVGAKVNDLGDVVGFFLDEIEPAPARTWRKPADTGDVGYDVIDEMADSASKRVVSVGGEVLERLGNVAVVATKERVYVYRLEAISDGE